jgi:hypothetical protein
VSIHMATDGVPSSRLLHAWPPHCCLCTGREAIEAGALHIVGALSKPQLQHLHVSLSGPQHLFSRQTLTSLKQHHEDLLRFKGKV